MEENEPEVTPEEIEDQEDEIVPERKEEIRNCALLSSTIYSSLGTPRKGEEGGVAIEAFSMALDVYERIKEQRIEIPSDLLEELLLLATEVSKGMDHPTPMNNDFIGVVQNAMVESGNFEGVKFVEIEESPFMEQQIRNAVKANGSELNTLVSKVVGKTFIGCSNDEIKSAFDDLILIREIVVEIIEKNTSSGSVESLLAPEEQSPQVVEVLELLENIGFSIDMIENKPWSIQDTMGIMGIEGDWINLTSEEQTNILVIMNSIATKYGAELEVTLEGPMIIAKEKNEN